MAIAVFLFLPTALKTRLKKQAMFVQLRCFFEFLILCVVGCLIVFLVVRDRDLRKMDDETSSVSVSSSFGGGGQSNGEKSVASFGEK